MQENKNINTKCTDGEKKLPCLSLQKCHHNLRDFEYWAIVEVVIDPNIATIADSGVLLLRKAWRIVATREILVLGWMNLPERRRQYLARIELADQL